MTEDLNAIYRAKSFRFLDCKNRTFNEILELKKLQLDRYFTLAEYIEAIYNLIDFSG